MKDKLKDPSAYISPLKINGLNGRVMELPSKRPQKSGNDILFIYGHHSSLERWWGLAQALSNYGNVTMPDVPGFGGMDSMYKIGSKPTVDNLADFLADFVRTRYKGKPIIITGMSFGFVIATRMLQRHPELVKSVRLLVSVVGFASKDDFTFSRTRYYSYLWLSTIFMHRPFSTFFRYVLLSNFTLRLAYARTHNAKHKFKNAKSKEEVAALMSVEIKLWQENDVKTYMFTTTEFLKLDNTKVKVNLPVYQVAAKADHFFSNEKVAAHMRQIFLNFESYMTNMSNHAPSVIADEASASSYIPEKLHLLLNKI